MSGIKEKKKQVRLMNNRSRAREIVKEISNFGVNDEQIMHVIYLLSLNLENIENMKEITNFLKKFTNNINTENKKDNIISNKTNKIILN
tara:strand:- start:261 stop:527 length:267 start_codon:yes stop_codon:yes gene_type:complete